MPALAALAQEHVEYILKLKKGDNLKILSKRYSDLHQFHQTLSEQNIIDRSSAPDFVVSPWMSLSQIRTARET